MATLLSYAWIVPVVFVIVFFALNVRLKPVCPSCGRRSTDRIKRPFLIKKILFFLPLLYMQCWFCHKKYYHLAIDKKSPKNKTGSLNAP
nr:hypothetical protein [uncultured Arsenicibacter sp.]